MKKQTITKLKAVTAMAMLSVSAGYAQNNLGAACGCPPVNTRPNVLMSTLAVSGGANDGDLTATNTVLTCDKNWILDKKIFVPSGKELIVKPGTVVKGRHRQTADSATAIIVERGGKLISDGGTDACGIVFTAEADPMNGSYPISNKGQWGGIVINGKATNNLTFAANGPYQPGQGDGKLAVADGLGIVEGFATSDPRYYFGADLTHGESFDDNDNSGTIRYTSIRFAGAILAVGGEINALSLGSVGRGTTMEHFEVISSADDNMEFWGGTVNIKYFTALYGNDDQFDWDDGYSGKAQFVFTAMCPDTTSASVDADNGFEMDADDQKSNNIPRSHPVIYNATMISNHKNKFTSDNSGLAAMRAKELTEGEIYNSIFANFKMGFDVTKSLGSRTGSSEAWHNWANSGGNGSQSLKVKCNVFTGCLRDISVDNGAASHADSVQFFTTDLNTHMASIPGFNGAWAMNSTTNAVSTQFDAVPNPALSNAGCPAYPADDFFIPVNYKGAFSSSGQAGDWLSDWTLAQVLNVSQFQICPTDINGDGTTNNSDFLIFVGRFNQTCQ